MFDIVVVQPTIDIGQAVLRVEGDLVLVGAGTTKAGVPASPYDSSVRVPYWGSRSELFEVLRARQVRCHPRGDRGLLARRRP
ncbi:MAG: hypothetical protein ACXWDA_03040, partial [Aeromicrobium sp.]